MLLQKKRKWMRKEKLKAHKRKGEDFLVSTIDDHAFVIYILNAWL